jgi:hypothetical protein
MLKWAAMARTSAPEMWFSLADAAEMTGTKPAVLLGWVRAGKFVPSMEVVGGIVPNALKYQFSESDVARLEKFVKRTTRTEPTQQAAPGAGVAPAFYTPAELAKVWGLSVDSIRKMFDAEPGVLKLGEQSKKRRRRYVTLRIPVEVAARVHKRLGS